MLKVRWGKKVQLVLSPVQTLLPSLERYPGKWTWPHFQFEANLAGKGESLVTTAALDMSGKHVKPLFGFIQWRGNSLFHVV